MIHFTEFYNYMSTEAEVKAVLIIISLFLITTINKVNPKQLFIKKESP
jgi:hypothetical protein